MNPNFVRYRRELGEEKIAAFEAFCFNRAEEVARPHTALMNAPLTQRLADAGVRRVFEAASGDYDTSRICERLVQHFEGPGVMPGLVEVRGFAGEFEIESRNIYQERGAPFTLENLLAPTHYGLTEDPEFYFEDVHGSGAGVLLNCFHLTQRGVEFCMACFPERVHALREAERAGMR